MNAFNSIDPALVSTTVPAGAEMHKSFAELRAKAARWLLCNIASALLAAITLCLLLPQAALGATVFTNNAAAGANWSVNGNWNNGLPGTGNAGTINTPAIAIADVALTTADITVTSGGSLRLLTVGNVANSVLIQSGGILQHAGTNPGGTAITFNDGARLGKNVTNGGAATANAILVASSGTLHANAIRGDGRVDNSFIALTLNGALSAGNTDSTLYVKPTLISDAPLNINPTATNNPFNGKVIVEGGAGAPGYLILQGTGALINATGVDVRTGGVLRFDSSVNAISLSTVTIGNGRRVEWNGSSTYSITAPQLDLQDGAILGKWRANSVGFVNERLTIAANSTTYASHILGDGRLDDNSLTLRLNGAFEGVGTSTLQIQPNATITANTSAGVDIAPTTQTNSFAGSVVVSGNANGARGILGLGNGALVNVTNLTINSGGTLRFLGNTVNPLDASKIPSVTIPSGARAEWLGTNSYAGTPIIMNLNGGSFLGQRVTNTSGTSRETLLLGSGTVTIDEVGDDNRLAENNGLILRGAISGSASSRLLIQPSAASVSFQGSTLIEPTAVGGNSGMAGTVEVLGQVATARKGILIIRGTSPLGTSDVIVGQEGFLDVRGSSLSNVDSIKLAGTGQIRFRNTGGSTLANTSLSGNGLLRSEASIANSSTNELLDTASLQALSLNNVLLVDDNSAGTLTFQTTTLTINAASSLQMEFGATQNDKLVVQGNLNLSGQPDLELSDLGNLTPGVYTLATYTGTLTGTFGDIVNATNLTFVGINYGSGINSLITVEFAPLPAPEPSALCLVGLGMCFLSARRRRKQ
jgi:hypothetical protein